MSKYEGLYTFDVDNHRYIPVGQSDGIIDCFDFKRHESTKPLITDRYPRETVRNWAEVVGGKDDISVIVGYDRTTFENKYGAKIVFTRVIDFTDEEFYESKVLHRSIIELCGEEEE